MNKYYELRECALCGEKYYIADANINKVPYHLKHHCENGDMGKSEFMGYILEEHLDKNIEIMIDDIH